MGKINSLKKTLEDLKNMNGEKKEKLKRNIGLFCDKSDFEDWLYKNWSSTEQRIEDIIYDSLAGEGLFSLKKLERTMSEAIQKEVINIFERYNKGLDRVTGRIEEDDGNTLYVLCDWRDEKVLFQTLKLKDMYAEIGLLATGGEFNRESMKLIEIHLDEL